MPLDERPCETCGARFSIAEPEPDFLEKVAPLFNRRIEPLPLPASCPGCRELQRLAFRNEWNLYRRKCDASGKDLISIYDAGSPYTVFDPKIWWSDDYDPLVFGRDIDFTRPFFEQFHDLNLAVPKAAIQNAKSENSDYTNYAGANKNCYLVVGSSYNEDCYYCYRVFQSRFVCDSYDLQRCESCYECLQGTGLYNCVYSRNCDNSSNLIHCRSCRSCKDCYGCTGLENKQYCVFNEQMSASDYEEKLTSLRQRIGDIALVGAPAADRKWYMLNCEDCSGDQLVNCSNCHSCFTQKGCQDCRYCGTSEDLRDCYDTSFAGNCELMYHTSNHRDGYHVLFSSLVWYSNDVIYSTNCFSSANLFGCTGMKRNQNCILNRQYSEAEYQVYARRLVAHMRETGEWGRYFPSSISPFPINSSVAFEYSPITEEKARSLGYRWLDDDPTASGRGQNASQPDGANPHCVVSGKAFRITKQERELCDRLGVPLPTKSPDVRQKERMAQIERRISSYIRT
ncbi:MAG: hypothetical protein U0136_06560 [Bdellovibrionota bacterium]